MKVYRIPTYWGRHLNLESHHAVMVQCSTVVALFNCAEGIVTNEGQPWKQVEFAKSNRRYLPTATSPISLQTAWSVWKKEDGGVRALSTVTA